MTFGLRRANEGVVLIVHADAVSFPRLPVPTYVITIHQRHRRQGRSQKFVVGRYNFEEVLYTRKLCYRKDDRTMRPIRGVLKIFMTP